MKVATKTINTEALTDSLASGIDAGTPVFALIDPMLGEPLALPHEVTGDQIQRCREDVWQRPVHQVLLSSEIDLPSHHHPYLVALDGSDDPWLAATVELAAQEQHQAWEGGLCGTGMAPMRVSGWLSSSMHVADIAIALGDLMKVRTEAPTRARYLRLGDRRALDLLATLLGDGVMAGALGRIQRWAYVDPLGKLASLFGSESGELPQRLRLSRSQWTSFMQGALLHPTIARHLAACGEAASTSSQELYQRAATALGSAAAAARRWPARFQTSVDTCSWAALCLAHPGLAENAHILDRLNRPGEPGEAPETVHWLCGELDRLGSAPSGQTSTFAQP